MKQQREIIRQGFEFMEKRFEQVDKRFDDLHNHMNRWMTVMTVMIGPVGIAVTVSNLVG